jgi:MFS family permease
MPYTMLLAGFVKDVLHKGAFEQGILQSCQGVGAIGGSVFVASAAANRRGRMMIFWGALLGTSIVLFAISTNFWITLPIMLLIGAAQAGRMAIGQVLVQSYSAEEYRGRVQSVWFMQFSLVQFGTFLVSILAEVLGPQVAIGGLAALLVLAMVLIAVFVPSLGRLLCVGYLHGGKPHDANGRVAPAVQGSRKRGPSLRNLGDNREDACADY